MSKTQLEKLENKISRLKHDLQKNNALISELEVKKQTCENEINELEKKATLFRLEDLNLQLQAAGLNLKTLDIREAVQVLEARFHQEQNISSSPADYSVTIPNAEEEKSDVCQLANLEDPFRVPKEET